MHFQWASDDHLSPHVQRGRGLCCNYVNTYQHDLQALKSFHVYDV